MDELSAPRTGGKPRRLLRLAAFAVAGSALFAAYWFTRPPELVWWESPRIGNSDRHVRALVPKGWELEPGIAIAGNLGGGHTSYYRVSPVDRRPTFIRRLFPVYQDESTVNIDVTPYRNGVTFADVAPYGMTRLEEKNSQHARLAYRIIRPEHLGIRAGIVYVRTNRSAFNRTYEQICNSLTIE